MTVSKTETLARKSYKGFAKNFTDIYIDIFIDKFQGKKHFCDCERNERKYRIQFRYSFLESATMFYQQQILNFDWEKFIFMFRYFSI